MIESTFQLAPGLGAARERALWSSGVRRWDDLGAGTMRVLPRALGARLVEAVDGAREALARGDLAALAAALPARERWRLLGAFADEAVYLDIETDEEDGVTVVGLLDRDGPRVLLAGRDLGQLPCALERARLLVTYNGGSFDLPILRQAFRDLPEPPAHVDLRPVWARLGHVGGLKALEEREGMARPARLRGLDGSRATWLWRHARTGDRRALALLVEYNLYDVINLRPLAALAYNRLAAATEVGAPALEVSYRGDVLYDVTKLLLGL